MGKLIGARRRHWLVLDALLDFKKFGQTATILDLAETLDAPEPSIRRDIFLLRRAHNITSTKPFAHHTGSDRKIVAYRYDGIRQHLAKSA